MSLIITNIGFRQVMEHHGSDHSVLLLIVTNKNCLTVLFLTRYGDMGVLILFVHDIVDPTLELAKLCQYLGSRNDSIGTFFHYVSEKIFILFVFQW